MDPLAIPSLQHVGAWIQWVIDLGQVTAAGNHQIVDFPYPIEFVRQIWFTGYAADNLSTPRVKLGLSASGFNNIQHVVSHVPRENSFSREIPIINYDTVVLGQVVELHNPIPLFNSSQYTGPLTRVEVTFTGWDNAAVTADEFIAFFAIVLGDPRDFNTQYGLIPRNERYWNGPNLFTHRA